MRTDCLLHHSGSLDYFAFSRSRSHVARPATLQLPAATLRLLRGWRAPSSGLRARWMALEVVGASNVPCALSQPPVSQHAATFADKSSISGQVAFASAYSTASSVSTAGASAVAEAATAPQHDMHTAAAPTAVTNVAGHEHSERQRSAQTGAQLPWSHSPALQFEVSWELHHEQA
jgi:hypothetical protein